jgi:hypothetical protein
MQDKYWHTYTIAEDKEAREDPQADGNTSFKISERQNYDCKLCKRLTSFIFSKMHGVDV